jgi:hypothetical protein
MSVPNPEVQCPSGKSLNRGSHYAPLIAWTETHSAARLQPVPAGTLGLLRRPHRVFADLPARNIWVIISARPETKLPASRRHQGAC